MEENVVEETVRIDRYEKEIDVPSNGYLGGPKKITIRAMTTAEEKILYSSRDFSFITKICKACTVKPKGIDWSLFLPQDFQFILFQIRELTFGSEYRQPYTCPHCGSSQEAVINIANFKYTLLDEGISEKLFIDLPISKAKVHLKLISQQEIDNIEDETNKLFAEGKVSDPESHSMVKKMTAMIDFVTGVDFENENDKFSWINKLHLADFNAIRNKLGEVQWGLENNTEVECARCGKKVEVVGTICPEFFRPTK